MMSLLARCVTAPKLSVRRKMRRLAKPKKDERLVQYVKGRDAYENARTAGDFSEAYALSRNLALQGDKNGERLLKMVYMQLGWGAHRDYVQAYGWLSEGIADGEKYLVIWREKLIAKMTPDQLATEKKQIAIKVNRFDLI